MSNIVNVFNPPPSRDLTPEETKDCVPCQIMSTCFALAAGYWFASGRVFENDKISVEENLKKNPIWWRNAVKGFGVGLLGFGVVRGTEGILWGTKSEVLE
ncbi:uncharacterized protein CYBJADRAFT_173169 [Cyberlindnera jadinii NRRL Y-1542]|uniref:DUF4536 domain-containing protein n=1 Tax=Cyberlindnera jadinii (strain ATCC 18201 / CBS 1600 / BCRC 20928 / JCM 3617 / NBRC 0987 / NRRL Y-1542) TaxID=983966 RepID=A0A1E4RU63_CYBJN|nr:hypothetical protein CYBJADRAFT_55919 [Cyberlindnera jadinii NRRL Y-1542]XP_020070808.1 hypothetical protein CYBJADRAFT_173169 [Cyberlindnera jadinii NRRL Y-1542]ODV70812.1 hypothetical protein CYBJADRAFT_55919 [Cyberlindnera jadinii NRRL Y-1542]ODV73769.1 hypothetical protein CYBJADRAFT_173169 [Cyberlindnera jadinii NRRL Y-1542]